ncbi:MAG: hypothetical protein KF894_06950 [Labilithrix sp.]|nr:hypothetical protein [Labilithrix sp.]
MRGRRALVLLVLAVVAGALLAVFAIQERTPPRSPTEQVPVIWQTAREAPMHVFHVGEKKIACVECHTSPDAAPSESECAKCHASQTETAHRGAGDATTTCLSCHAFGAGGPPKTCNACHAAATRASAAPALEHHAGAELPCGACHSVHGKERAVLSDCTICHRETSAVHGRLEAHAREQELDASMDLSLDAAVLAFIREGGAPIASHGAPFGGGGEPIGDGGVPSARHVAEGGGLVAADPHATLSGQVCGACHAPHSGKEAARGTCEGCHVDAHRAPPRAGAPDITLASRAPAIAPRGPRVAGHEACVTCHEPHRARRADVRACEGCHADRRAAAQVSGHAACTGCHAPHAPGEAKTSCSASCHAGVTTLAAPRVAAHASCTSCHDPHRPDVSAGQACVRCHESTKPSHPAIASAKGAQTCIGCHAPHGGRGASPGAAAHGSRAPAAGAPSHGATAAACTSCHTNAKDDRALHAKGTACTACHAPHAFQLASAGASLCASCHAEEKKATAARPGHASCSGCHGAAHAPNAKPACKSCHVEQTRTAPPGHASCTSCHDAHSGSLGDRASCTSCHANKATALHANVAQGCDTCHRAHGPKGVARPAACASCHAKPSLPGLHSVTAHGSCETCHSAHAPPRSDRASCIGACHTAQRNHQPEAKVCKGCHLFRR